MKHQQQQQRQKKIIVRHFVKSGTFEEKKLDFQADLFKSSAIVTFITEGFGGS